MINDRTKITSTSSETKEEKNPEIISHVYGKFDRKFSFYSSRVSALPSGNLVVCDDNNIDLFDVDKNQFKNILTTKSKVDVLTVRADGLIVAGLKNGDMQLIDIQNQNNNMLIQTGARMDGLLALSDMNHIVCSHYDNTQVWNIADKECILEKEKQESYLSLKFLSFDAKNSRSFIRYRGDRIELVDIKTLGVTNTYIADDITGNNFRVGSLKLLSKDGDFAVGYSCWKTGGFGRIAVGSKDNFSLVKMIQVPHEGMTHLLDDGSVITHDPLSGLHLCKISDTGNITVIQLTKPSTFISNLFFASLSDGRVLCMGEDSYDVYELACVSDYNKKLKQLKTGILPNTVGLPPDINNLIIEYAASHTPRFFTPQMNEKNSIVNKVTDKSLILRKD